MQRKDISDLHKLRYCHLVTTSHQMPKKMRDQAEQFAVTPERVNNKATPVWVKKENANYVRAKTG